MHGSGSKRHLEWFKDHIELYNHDPNLVWDEIESLIVKTFISVQPSVSHLYKSGQPNDLHGNMCFEILGFDIMFDSDLKPYLIEVNHAPSFNTDSKLDLLIKKNVLNDTFNMLYLVGPKGKSM